MISKKQEEHDYDNIKSTHPVLCADGKYRWMYDIPMLTNPSILFDVYGVLAISFGIVWLFNVIILICSGDMSFVALWDSIKMFLIISILMFVLGYVAYFFVSWYYGWKYTVIFTLDEHEVENRQLPSTVKKAQIIGQLTTLAGVAGGKSGMMSLGVLAATRTSMTSRFDRVRRLIPCRRMNLIKVNGLFSRNRVYVPDEDFDFVYQFLCDNCPNVRKKG